VPDNFLIVAATTVFREHIDLSDRSSGCSWDILNVTKRTPSVEQVCWIEEADTRQFIDNPLLPDVGVPPHRPSPQLDVRLNVWQLHQLMRATINLLHVVTGVASLFVCFTSILFGIGKEVIAEATLLRRQTIFVSAGG